jgi:hypothetical protein
MSKIPKPIDMTIHWKALEEHFPIVLKVLGCIHFAGSYQFFEILTVFPSSMTMKYWEKIKTSDMPSPSSLL